MNLALFDFDGTVSQGDTWTPFMRLAVAPARMIGGVVIISAVVIGYRLGMVSASRARQTAARAGLWGAPSAAVRQLGHDYARNVIPAGIRPRALERIAWHKSQGHDVVVVSASLDVYLRPWCESHNIDCICTTLEERAGRFTGRYVEGDCVGAEKARRIRQRYDLSKYSVVYAYGDTREDREMLELAHEKYFRWQQIVSCDALEA